ncbi:hypothetical protein BJ742DRAFT_192699 [Cladochytrium replicatum]|nr:hypothetical protein BJ742DRAFT_192699 [Cladochytrium replicatum]
MFAVEQRRQLMWLCAARAALFVWASVVASSKISRIEWTSPYHWIGFSIAWWAACVSGLSFATWGRTLWISGCRTGFMANERGRQCTGTRIKDHISTSCFSMSFCNECIKMAKAPI